MANFLIGGPVGLVACLVLGTLAPAWAESPVLTLADTVRLARDRSLGVTANRERLRSSEAQQRAASAVQYPILSVTSSPTYAQVPAGTRSASPGAGVGLPAPTTSGPYIDDTVSVSQLLFDSSSTRNQVAIAEDQVTISQLGLHQAEEDAMANAGATYFQVLRADGLAHVAQEAYRQAQDHERLGNLRIKAGSGTRAELLQLQAQLANAQVALIQAQNAVVQARLALANVVNAPIGDRPLASASVSPLAVMLDRDLPVSLTRRP